MKSLILHPMDDVYQTIAAASEGLHKDRGSKFMAYAWPVESEVEIEAQLADVRKAHPKARHCCYAWRLGTTGDHFRANDEGEPSGTAGRPILAQIDKYQLTNVLVAVVRYFGGTLLGTGGLIQAYRGAAADALAKARTKREYLKKRVKVTTGYQHLNEIISYVKGNGWDMFKEDYGKICTFEVPVRLSDIDSFVQYLNNYEGTKAEVL
jgi:uncharacterized YigZ family protein